jgi:hypothetical protein
MGRAATFNARAGKRPASSQRSARRASAGGLRFLWGDIGRMGEYCFRRYDSRKKFAPVFADEILSLFSTSY